MSVGTLDLTPGDLVLSYLDTYNVGMVVSVRETNHDTRFQYPYIFYVFFADQGEVQARFRRDLRKV